MKEKKLLKFLKNALTNDYLYSSEELIYMKQETNNLEKIIENKLKENSKGFGKK